VRPLREVADEIVVAVDSRVDEALLGAYDEAADRLLRVDRDPGTASVAALHAHCSGDWVLTLDGDEAVSAKFQHQLPELIASRDVLQYWLPMRWLYPDGGHWLDELPWSPDFHNRLVRNDGTLHFPGFPHTGAAATLPARWLDAPLYHLNLVLLTEAERAAKAERNEAAWPGLVAPGGGRFNHVYYVPERHASLRPRPVPPEDTAALASVLAAAPSNGSGPPAGEVPLVTREEIEARWARRELSPGAYRAGISAFERDPRMYAGEHRAIHVRVVNEGNERWPWGLERRPAIRVEHRLLRDGATVADWVLSPLPHEIEPGASTIVPVPVRAPDQAGRYVLEIDLVHEGVPPFGCALALPLTVAEGTARPKR